MANGQKVLAWVMDIACALMLAYGSVNRVAAGDSVPARTETPEIWRTPSNDGTNCLYLLLCLSGRKVDYADVAAAINASGRGRSLAGLRDAARHFGLDVSVYQWRPNQLIHTPSPVIAYLDNYDREGGYFALIFQGTERGYGLVNGAQATIKDLRAEDFYHVWSGYVLAPTQPYPWRVEWLSYGISIIILFGYGWFRVRRALATRPAPQLDLKSLKEGYSHECLQ